MTNSHNNGNELLATIAVALILGLVVFLVFVFLASLVVEINS